MQVAITGLGVVCPLAGTPRDLWNALLSGTSAVGPVTRFDATRFACRLAAEVDDGRLPAEDGDLRHELRRMDRFVRYALVAARRALAHGGVGLDAPDRDGLAGGGVYLGLGLGGLPHMEAGVVIQETRGSRKTSPYLIPSLIPAMAAGIVSMAVGIDGPQLTFAGACASGSQALGEAARAIQDGRLEWALAGGTEAVITPITFSGFHAMRALTTRFSAGETPRPFDERRDGMVVGEGAVLCVLETADRARARGAPILARLVGYGTASGAETVVRRSTAGLARAMRAALADAELEPAAIDAVFAQAQGLPDDDQELAALEEVFGADGHRPAVTSIEGHLGHTFGASGPLHTAAAIGALHHQEVPPTLHYERGSELAGRHHIVRRREPRPLTYCLINAAGFGGANATLICAAPEAVR